ncbi:MAG: 6,7-dimethyl-8-ribityllumazine synthase [Candidatus Paceibacterota bacterium]|jgi:6,7-dimethyl-8-ribityllumazine synthase
MQREQQARKINKSAEDLSVALVVSEYNSDITYPMRDAAIQTLKNAGVKEENIFVSEAPGGFEIPILCQRLAKTNEYNGIIAIGCVIRGDTDHYVYIANEATRGVMDVMLKYDIPIANAILTVNNLEQAKIRSEGDMNKGVEAAKALLASID